MKRHDFRARLPFSLRLLCHRPLHRLWQLDVAAFALGHLDTPGACLLVDHFLQALVDTIALGQQMIEIRLAENAAQRGLPDQRRRAHGVDRLDDCLTRVHDTEVHNGIDLNGDASARFLRGNLEFTMTDGGAPPQLRRAGSFVPHHRIHGDAVDGLL
jgi:hypothetical protein